MPEAKPDTARLEARLVLLLLVELPTLARAPVDMREERLVPLIELIVLVVVDIFLTPFYLSIFLIFCLHQSSQAVSRRKLGRRTCAVRGFSPFLQNRLINYWSNFSAI
jgi:hypothetical protein